MPICRNCGTAYLDGESHACAERRSSIFAILLEGLSSNGPSERAFVVLGLVLLLFALPSAMAGWLLLPPGRYPVVIVGLPALPMVWLGSVCLRKAGVPIEQYMRSRPRSFGLFVGVGSLVVLLGLLLVASAMGWPE